MRGNRKYLNNHIIAFIKLELQQNKINNTILANNIAVSEEQINKLLCSNYIGKKKDLLMKIINYLDLKENDIFYRDLSFEKLRNAFFNSFFYCFESRKKYYDELQIYVKNMNHTPYIIDWLIIDFIYTVILVKDKEKVNGMIDKFQVIYLSLSSYYKKLYSIYFIEHLKNLSMFDRCLENLTHVFQLKCNDKHLNGRLYYTAMSVYRGIGNIKEAQNCFLLARSYFIRSHNLAMLENLNIKYSGMLRMIGEIHAALYNDLRLLEDYTIKQYRLRNIEILYNNIAWTYSLLHDYKKAIIYYQEALETLNDNDVYFNMAYCCFKVGEKTLAMNYLQLGKKAPNCGEYIYLLLDWLEQMIKDVYSNKSFQMLQNILLKYENDLEEVDKNTIQIEIINYYYYNGMYEEAINALQPLMGKQLISPSELIFAKDNSKTHDTLSFEDMDDTWNDKMIIKDDDLFFDDEKINDDDWEELDDSFSSFAFN